MKKSILLLVLVACAIAAIFIFRTREKRVMLHDLVWVERDGVVTFEFRVSNPTEDEVVASIVLIAERTLELRTGPKITEAGRGDVEIRLSPKEEKKEEGRISLASSVKGSLTVFPHVTVKKPKMPEPTPDGVAHR